MAGIILTAAGLGFLGLGAQPPLPEWGAMISRGRAFILDQWWVATMPGFAIVIVSLGFCLFGDGLRDVLDPRFYADANLELMPFLSIGKFLLTHEPMEDVLAGFINVHGHIHPGIRLRGKARQGFSVACFHLSKQHLCMPAFGELTGLAIRKHQKNDRIFAVTDEGIFDVSNL
jgi:hypothetical protein